jgi:hypothetical protein
MSYPAKQFYLRIAAHLIISSEWDIELNEPRAQVRLLYNISGEQRRACDVCSWLAQFPAFNQTPRHDDRSELIEMYLVVHQRNVVGVVRILKAGVEVVAAAATSQNRHIRWEADNNWLRC